MKQHTIYRKFIFAYIIVSILSLLLVGNVSSSLINSHLSQEKSDTMYEEAVLFASGWGREYDASNSTLSMIKTHLSALSINLDADIWIIDSSYAIVLDSSATYDENTTIQDFDPTYTGTQSYSTGRFYGMLKDTCISVIAPITSGFTTKGYVVIHYPVSNLEKETEHLVNICYIATLITLALSLIILLVFTHSVFFPIKKISTAADEYAQGNFEYQCNVHSTDEIGSLSATLNYMSTELKNFDDYQKKFISNISHDFRSPLTSIKGYVEAIKDGTIPHEMQDKYLDIVIFETERLNKLTRSLLTLNDMDKKGGKNMLDFSEFDINEVIRKTAATFEGTCTKKKINIKLSFSSKNLFVNADYSKIQQVLYNLIDNATKFSHNNSSILIETSEKNDRVFVSVKDSGIGIPKDSIKKIWDRFYKTDLSRGKDKTGTGLGLAIVKEIINSHGENINVISTEGVGTEFIFTLSKPKNKSIIL